MEAPSSWDLGLFSFLLERLFSFCGEFAQDWSSNDMRVTIFKILLGWLLGSLVAIHMAWKFYGATVNDMYYRQGSGGQNGGTPDGSSNFTSCKLRRPSQQGHSAASGVVLFPPHYPNDGSF
ncbi:T-cell leukemia translocation-altered gene protein homolog isoform X2 [Carcharodon carcharias]|uniref:T-cell leukemia translocation-altered gene protein homolog isoform X2 n=1 Tax=Carcharodon carcharias TaxID=13397 RepID=UPI001B7EF56A|nr:T-cell leukemia translocation-altered gene protein homolog isoform X2 [Carcharodon carcharias]